MRKNSEILSAAVRNKASEIMEAYIGRMARIYNRGNASASDFCLECPICGTWMEFRSISWKCLKRDCAFIMPPEFSPPSPDEIKAILVLKKRIAFLEKYGNLFTK